MPPEIQSKAFRDQNGAKRDSARIHPRNIRPLTWFQSKAFRDQNGRKRDLLQLQNATGDIQPLYRQRGQLG